MIMILSVITYTGSIIEKMEFSYEGNCVFMQNDYLPEFSIQVSESSSVANEKEIGRRRRRRHLGREEEKIRREYTTGRNPRRVGPRPPSLCPFDGILDSTSLF